LNHRSTPLPAASLDSTHDGPQETGRVLMNPRWHTEMSAFGGKAVIEWCCEESQLMTQSGHRHSWLFHLGLFVPLRVAQDWFNA
jgi:hypothetical protein